VFILKKITLDKSYEKIKSWLLDKHTLAYFFLFLISISISIYYYPRVFGTDDFQLIWAAYAIKNGALFSEKTWLISFFSYLGFYPFSHRPIGTPTVLAGLIIIFEAMSLGIEEVILFSNIVIFILVFFSSKKLAETIFKKKWYQFLFVLSIILSPNILYENSMNFSSRIFITLAVINILKHCLKILKGDNSYTRHSLLILAWIIVGIFTHRLWPILFLIPILLLILKLIMKSSKVSIYTIYTTMPVSLALLILGANFFYIDPNKILSPFFDNSTLYGLVFNLTIHYTLQIGLIFVFFPVGIVMMYKRLFKEVRQLEKTDEAEYMINFYMILFVVVFSFSLFTFYAQVVFLPILTIISIIGFKELMSAIDRRPYEANRIKFLILFSLFIISVLYTILYSIFWIHVNYWYIYVFSGLIFVDLLYILFSQKHRIAKINRKRFIEFFKHSLILISITIFTLTTVLGRTNQTQNSIYPWENRYLTEEEKDIIDFFNNNTINGIIFVAPPLIAGRIAGIGFLPAISNYEIDGKSLYYDIVTEEEVKSKTYLGSFSQMVYFYLFIYDDTNPISHLRISIQDLNVSDSWDLDILLEFRVQYIISVNPLYHGETYTPLQLELSLYDSDVPIFSTQSLDIWKIY
jgi:hypothetical protein